MYFNLNDVGTMAVCVDVFDRLTELTEYLLFWEFLLKLDSSDFMIGFTVAS